MVLPARTLVTRALLSLILPALALLPDAGMAQGSGGRIVGQVVELGSGRPLEGVQVVLQGASRGAVSDARGTFVLLGVLAGEYTLAATSIGFQPSTLENVQVVIDQTTRVTLEMSTTTIDVEGVTVTVDAYRVDPEVSGTRTTLDARQLAEIPTPRLEHTLALQAGVDFQASQHFVRFENGQRVAADGEAPRGLVVRGGDVSETGITLDGFSLQDRHSDWAYLGVNRSAVEQLQLQTGGFDASRGNVRSGLLQVVSREGDAQRFQAVGEVRYSPAQQKHFGPSIHDRDNVSWRTFAGPYAMDGVPEELVGTEEFPIAFAGWNNVAISNSVWGEDRLTPEGLLELWKWQHREIPYAQSPDWEVDLGFGGPTYLPWETTFWASVRSKRTWYAYPTGNDPRSQEENGQLRVTSRPTGNTRLGFTGLLGRTDAHTLAPNFGLYSTQDGDTQFGMAPVQLFESIYDKGSWVPLERSMGMVGLDFTHHVSPTAFYDLRLSVRRNRTDQKPIGPKRVQYPDDLQPEPGFNDSLEPAMYLPTRDGGMLPIWDWQEGHNVWFQRDVLGYHAIQGRGRFWDQSQNTAVSLGASVSWQASPIHLLKAGVDAELLHEQYHTLRYTELRHQVQPLHNNYRNVMFDERPLQVGAYLQDQLEYDGLILNLGVRLDHFDPRTSWYDLSGENRFNPIYNSRDFWVDPDDGSWIPDWYRQTEDRKTVKANSRTRISPRVGVSFPISNRAKLFANYGHFHQVPRLDYLYTAAIGHNRGGAVTLGNPNLDLLKTVSYEGGAQFAVPGLFTVQSSVYFRKVDNEVAGTAYRSASTGAAYNLFENKVYRDIRGFDLQLTRSFGEQLRGFVAYNWVQTSYGRRGFSLVTDDPTTNSETRQEENAEQGRPITGPSFRANLAWSPSLRCDGAWQIACGWTVSGLYMWRDGGEYEWPTKIDGKTRYVDVKDWDNVNLSLERALPGVGGQGNVFFLEITNVLNRKTLNTDAYNHPTLGSGTDYRESLRLPFLEGERQGNDRYGDWEQDHIRLHWGDWSRFSNPRFYSFGVRFAL